jgi:hypothetical protein
MLVKQCDKLIIRFGLAADGELRSSLWRLWVRGNETYLGARSHLGTTKASLHSSGVAVITTGTSRLDLKRRTIAPGWVVGPRLAFPGSESTSRLSGDRPTPKQVFEFPPPPPAMWRDFAVLISTENAQLADLEEAIPHETILMGPLNHRDGGQTWLATFLSPMAAEETRFIATHRQKIRIGVRSDPAAVKYATGLIIQDVASGETVLFNIPLEDDNIAVQEPAV